jgi:hypothetical protein
LGKNRNVSPLVDLPKNPKIKHIEDHRTAVQKQFQTSFPDHCFPKKVLTFFSSPGHFPSFPSVHLCTELFQGSFPLQGEDADGVVHPCREGGTFLGISIGDGICFRDFFMRNENLMGYHCDEKNNHKGKWGYNG